MQALAPPEPGQLVEVRRRRYIVNEVRASTLAEAPSADSGPLGAINLVSLTSVEDDGLGEELQVLWELEAGARVFEKENLPEVREFDDPARLDAFLDAVRWGAVSSADVKALQSPFRSGIEIEGYQLDPVVRALQMPRVNLLIADDVGLGKTIEAGLVLQELILRHRVRTALVLCPASLQVQWRDQMRDKFGLEFRIIDSAALTELRQRLLEGQGARQLLPVTLVPPGTISEASVRNQRGDLGRVISSQAGDNPAISAPSVSGH